MKKIENYRQDIDKLKEMTATYLLPDITENIKKGDMPGDQIKISEDHIHKAKLLFPELLGQLFPILEESEEQKAVITVCGGSGVGKSEIASLLSFYLDELGIGSYTLSGDNYPHRIPKYNDAERLRIFRESAIKGMMEEQEFSMERFSVIRAFQEAGTDAAPEHEQEYPWYDSYLKNGREGLSAYLGSNDEIGFDEVEEILGRFKAGEKEIWCRRMGRCETELWYEKVNFADIHVLVIEWTHGNSDNYRGVDIPILLNSTPKETLAHRRARNRDGEVDSPFTTMVLELEQNMLRKQAKKAKIIISKDAELLSQEQFLSLMEQRG